MLLVAFGIVALVVLLVGGFVFATLGGLALLFLIGGLVALVVHFIFPKGGNDAGKGYQGVSRHGGKEKTMPSEFERSSPDVAKVDDHWGFLFRCNSRHVVAGIHGSDEIAVTVRDVMGNERQVLLAIHMYADDYQGAGPMDSTNPTLVGSMQLLSNYVVSVKALHCPDDRRSGRADRCGY